MSTSNEPRQERAATSPLRGPTRRQLTVGSAWAVPSVAIAAAVPAWAGSICMGSLGPYRASGIFVTPQLLQGCKVTFAIHGASGGRNGGDGALITGTFVMPMSSVLTLVVGQGGGQSAGTSPGTGGAGYGAGGTATSNSLGDGTNGGGGGGSAILLGPASASSGAFNIPIVVAGGGGGGSGGSKTIGTTFPLASYDITGFGGDGGLLDGGPGNTGWPAYPGPAHPRVDQGPTGDAVEGHADGGAGGTVSAGGAGGPQPTISYRTNPPTVDPQRSGDGVVGIPGQDHGLGSWGGGDGGSSPDPTNGSSTPAQNGTSTTNVCNLYTPAGGGGGGWTGGGSGALVGVAVSNLYSCTSSGGGGGSSYIGGGGGATPADLVYGGTDLDGHTWPYHTYAARDGYITITLG